MIPVLERIVGVGADAAVWVGWIGPRRIAVKRPRGGADPGSLRREAAILARCHHPHILPLLALHEEGDEPALLLPYLPGGSLADRMERGPRIGWPEAARIGMALADALSHLHGQRVVHGDVSPANILLDEAGRPVLCDLGAAVVDGRVTGRVGTPGYVAAEVVAGAVPTPATDVHALAAVLYHLATGAPPATPERPAAPADELALALRTAGVPARARGALLAALSPEPADRPAADELRTALHPAAPGSRAEVPPSDQPSGDPQPTTVVVAVAIPPTRDYGPARPPDGPAPVSRQRRGSHLPAAVGIVSLTALSAELLLVPGPVLGPLLVAQLVPALAACGAALAHLREAR